LFSFLSAGGGGLGVASRQVGDVHLTWEKNYTPDMTVLTVLCNLSCRGLKLAVEVSKTGCYVINVGEGEDSQRGGKRGSCTEAASPLGQAIGSSHPVAEESDSFPADASFRGHGSRKGSCREHNRAARQGDAGRFLLHLSQATRVTSLRQHTVSGSWGVHDPNPSL
jgi:hypothetical protein